MPKENVEVDPKDTGRDEVDPKDTGRDEVDPKDTGRGGGDSPFGGGAGWVVVAFISPVGMSVPDLAVRMLSGSGAQSRVTGFPRTPLTDAAVLARDRARERVRLREEEKKLLDRLRGQQPGGGPPAAK